MLVSEVILKLRNTSQGLKAHDVSCFKSHVTCVIALSVSNCYPKLQNLPNCPAMVQPHTRNRLIFDTKTSCEGRCLQGKYQSNTSFYRDTISPNHLQTPRFRRPEGWNWGPYAAECYPKTAGRWLQKTDVPILMRCQVRHPLHLNPQPGTNKVSTCPILWGYAPCRW